MGTSSQAFDRFAIEVDAAARTLDRLDRDRHTRPAEMLLDQAISALEALIGACRDYLVSVGR